MNLLNLFAVHDLLLLDCVFSLLNFIFENAYEKIDTIVTVAYSATRWNEIDGILFVLV